MSLKSVQFSSRSSELCSSAPNRLQIALVTCLHGGRLLSSDYQSPDCGSSCSSVMNHSRSVSVSSFTVCGCSLALASVSCRFFVASVCYNRLLWKYFGQ